MTRQEANQKAYDAWTSASGGYAPSMVNVLIALGLFKLDEPITPTNKFASILADWVDPVEVAEFWKDLDEAGLEIVEKDKSKSEFKYNPANVR